MKACFTFALLTIASVALADEAHFGYRLDQRVGAVVVSTPLQTDTAGPGWLWPGDEIVSLSGRSIRKTHDIEAIVRTKKAGDRVPVRVRRGGKTQTVSITLASAESVAKEIQEAEESRRSKARAEREREDRERAAIRDRIATRGPLLFVGKVVTNIIGRPEIVVLAENISGTTIEAVKFNVTMFDKFGDPAVGLFGDGNSSTFLYQKAIGPGRQVTMVLGIPWHETCGKAIITATDFVMEDDAKFTPPTPDNIEVRR